VRSLDRPRHQVLLDLEQKNADPLPFVFGSTSVYMNTITAAFMTKLPDPQLTATKRPCVSVPMHFVHLADASCAGHTIHYTEYSCKFTLFTRHGGICSAALRSTRPAVHGTREYQTRRHDYEALPSGLPTSISSRWFGVSRGGSSPFFVRRKAL